MDEFVEKINSMDGKSSFKTCVKGVCAFARGNPPDKATEKILSFLIRLIEGRRALEDN